MEYLSGKVVSVLVVKSLDDFHKRIEVLIKNGYDIFEVTLRTGCAIKAIEILKRDFPQIKVGAGTILTADQLEQSIQAGADFGVAPGFNKDIVLAAKKHAFDFIPGVATPTEIELAIRCNVNLVKVFPAKVLGGVEFIKAISGPYHNMQFMPNGGIKEEDYSNYIALPNVTCVGGSWMF